MTKYQEMMILSVEQRRAYFRMAYALNLSKAHAQGRYQWPIERLSKIVDEVMEGFKERKVPSGPAFDETKKFFGIRSQKELFAFLEY